MIEKTERQFLLERLHSLSGVLPIGVFLLEHLFGNSFAVRTWGSPEAYNRYVIFLLSTPYVKYFMEFFVLALPIGFHAIYGLYITKNAKNNVSAYGYQRNWAFLLQRVTGLILVAYIAVHVFRERFASGMGEWAHQAAALTGADLVAANASPTAPYNVMATHLSNPLYYWFSVLGVLAACLHFSNGLWSFSIRWGITVGPRSQQAAQYACGLIFVALALVGVAALSSFTAIAKGS